MFTGFALETTSLQEAVAAAALFAFSRGLSLCLKFVQVGPCALHRRA
jgi:hypothetical protein